MTSKRTLGRARKRVVVIGGIVSLALAFGGCSNPGNGRDGSGGTTTTAGGSGGATGSGGKGDSASGGSSTGGSRGQDGTGGTTASGGDVGSGGQAGGTPGSGGGVGTGGAEKTGGTTGAGGRTSTGGNAQTGGGPGGSGRTGGASGQAGRSGQRSVSFGTLLDAAAVMAEAQQLAKSVAKPGSAQWQAKGDQHRTYRFASANADEPYRLYVPKNWDGKTSLPLAMFLHGSGADENTYVDQNNKQLLTLAEQHGYLLVAPLGAAGAYGNFLRLASPFGKPDEAAKLMAQVTADSERTNELSEQDVINVLELVLAEYPIDRASMFIFGHSMGSGGTWYIGGKYAGYWKGLAPMSGPFVQETVYPWNDLRNTFLFVTEGTKAPSVDGSHVLRDWLKANAFKAEYEEVNADHGGMIPLVLPDVFGFFDRSRGN